MSFLGVEAAKLSVKTCVPLLFQVGKSKYIKI
jgi:hypothetical protein